MQKISQLTNNDQSPEKITDLSQKKLEYLSEPVYITVQGERIYTVSYFDDMTFDVVIQHVLMYSTEHAFTPENHSIEFISRGKIKLEANGKILDLTAPVLFWMRSGGKYRFIVEENQNTTCEHVYFDFRGRRAEKMIQELERIRPEGYVIPKNPEIVKEIFAEQLKKYRQDHIYYHPDLVVNAERLILQAVQSIRQEQKRHDDPYGIIAAANKIKSDPFADYDFRVLASQAGISYEHYRRLFRELHGSPPAAFVLNRKMFLAAEMLQMTDMRIKEIMTTCKFDSMMNFSRTFKRYSGLSPVAYRKRFK